MKNMHHRYFISVFILIILSQSVQAHLAPHIVGGMRVSGQNSAFLEMHAGNPVDWYPWGNTAIREAEKAHKLLFISIGYSGCIWCHRMAEGAFSNSEVAKYMNKHFVNILIDKEQRPDIAKAFAEFVQQTGQPIGYPINIFATPQGIPFLATFYLPAKSNSEKIGLLDLAKNVIEKWKGNHARFSKLGTEILNKLKTFAHSDNAINVQSLSEHQYDNAIDQIANSVDTTFGGFGENIKLFDFPKIMLLMDSDDQDARNLAYLTLERICSSSVMDQLGGGFFNYSYDRTWTTPNFGKNIYIQLGMIDALLTAYEQTHNANYKRIINRTFSFINNKLTSDEGYLFTKVYGISRISRDGESIPGGYYLWDWYNALSILTDKDIFNATTYYYGFNPGGNNNEGDYGSINGMNLPYIAKSVHSVASLMRISDSRAKVLIDDGAEELAYARKSRIPPLVDRTMDTAWNGYAVHVYAKAAHILHDPSYLYKAENIETLMDNYLYSQGQDIVYQSYKAGKTILNGGLLDYCYFIDAELSLYDATKQKQYLIRAKSIMTLMKSYYWDNKNKEFYDTTLDDPIFLRFKTYKDTTLPSGNSIAAQMLLELGIKTKSLSDIKNALNIVKWELTRSDKDYLNIPYLFMNWPSYTKANLLIQEADNQH